MFSTTVAEGGPAMATRSRRRQRPKSQESLVPQPKAKRQRIPLTEQTFVNPDVQPDAPEPPVDKAIPVEAVADAGIENINPLPRKELHVRAKKSKHAERAASKGDGSLVLVSCPLALRCLRDSRLTLCRPAQTPTSSASCPPSRIESVPTGPVSIALRTALPIC